MDAPAGVPIQLQRGPVMTTPERLTPVLDAALDGTGLLLDAVTVSPAGKRRVVRVVVDHVLPDEGITDWPTDPLSLDEVADVTHAINAALDAGDVMGEAPYTLEVTSPGVTRPLTERRHFRRNVGRLICIVGAGEIVTGRLLRVTDDALTLHVAGTKKAPPHDVELALGDVGRGEVQIEFNRKDAAGDEPDDSDEEH
ncbi:Ribosome maturation factor rimP [Phycicoccus elongatus Lp2]|uniref:Ribosome maturation factor RimP n=2 Tax=Phycicoccus elongatus TaxID=101689 RepID=N0DZF2_9MICO|nr:Ribosome maturation factor rimP [Phycicoccus elongatus Lp2]